MNLGELVDAVELRSGVAFDRGGTIVGINEALDAISKERDWGWLQATWTFTSDGSTAYDPPAGWAKVRSVTVAGWPLPMLPITEIDDAVLFDQGWTVEGDQLVFRPAPQSGSEVQVRYYRNEPYLGDDEDEPLMPTEWHRGIVDYAACLLLERVAEYQRADRCKARYAALLAQMTQQANRAKGPHRVRVRPGSLL